MNTTEVERKVLDVNPEAIAHDTDENGMSAWHNNKTLESIGPDPVPQKECPADWFEKHSYRMSAERVKELVTRAEDKVVFLCGIPANDRGL